jgi:hypothetical protein
MEVGDGAVSDIEIDNNEFAAGYLEFSVHG